MEFARRWDAITAQLRSLSFAELSVKYGALLEDFRRISSSRDFVEFERRVAEGIFAAAIDKGEDEQTIHEQFRVLCALGFSDTEGKIAYFCLYARHLMTCGAYRRAWSILESIEADVETMHHDPEGVDNYRNLREEVSTHL